MFFRFGSAVVLVVVTSLLGILVEKQNLTLRRDLSSQHYRMDVLQEEHALLRLRSQQLAAIERLFATVEETNSVLTAVRSEPLRKRPPVRTASGDAPIDQQIEQPGQHSLNLPPRRVPLLFWRQPVPDPRSKRGPR